MLPNEADTELVTRTEQPHFWLSERLRTLRLIHFQTYLHVRDYISLTPLSLLTPIMRHRRSNHNFLDVELQTCRQRH